MANVSHLLFSFRPTLTRAFKVVCLIDYRISSLPILELLGASMRDFATCHEQS